MPVIELTCNSRNSGQCISSDAVPGTFHAIFLVKNGGTHEAVAVCPEENELLDVLSGRVSRVVYFKDLTNPAINAAEKTLLTASSFHELRL